MKAYRGRLFCLWLLGMLAPSFATAAPLPDGAAIRVDAFAFPRAAHSGAEEEARQLSAEFRQELVSALQQAGLVPVLPPEAKDGGEAAAGPAPGKPEQATAQTGTKEPGAGETVAGEEGVTHDAAPENDALMAVVEAVEKAEKDRQDRDRQEQEAAASPAPEAEPAVTSGAYAITGTVTRYEEQAGAPVNLGRTRRSRAEVTVACTYRVSDPAGKVILSDSASASASRIVPETVDIHDALQQLKKKAFFEAGHRIAERVSGKTRVRAKEDAEPGSDDDEYADTPGKRLKSGASSGQRTKWTIN